MAIVNQYQSTVPSIRFVFKSGVVAHFINGRYRTSKAEEVAELNSEIAAGNIHISASGEVDTALDDPLVGFKQKVIADFLAAQKEEAAKSSTSDQSPVKPASSDAFIPVAAGSGTQAAVIKAK